LAEQKTISIVDDDESVREGLVSLMESHGYLAEGFESGMSFLNSSRKGRTDCLIVDMHMPGMSGLELLGQLDASGAAAPAIMITARHDVNLRARALQRGVLCYLPKPFKEAELMNCIRSAVTGDSHEDPS
jgi:FixJ family two-component response regulator